MSELGDLGDLARVAQHSAVSSPQMNDFVRALLEQRTLRATLGRYLFSHEDVETAEQLALVSIATNLTSWSGTGDPSPWLRQIAANEAKMIIRSRDRRRNNEAAAMNETAHFVERLTSFVASSIDFDRCFDSLRPELAEALTLRQQGFSYAEIGSQLGVAEGTVKTRVRTARSTLASCLTQL